MSSAIDFTAPEVSAKLMRILIENTPVAYVLLDKERRIRFVNEYFLTLRKTSRQSVLGQKCYDVSNGGIPCQNCPAEKAVVNGKRCLVHRKDILPDGTVRFLDDYAIPLHREDGTSEFVLEILVNRTNEMMLREHNIQLFLSILDTFVSILDKKDAYTSSHSHDVTAISVKLGKYIGMTEEECMTLHMAALLHDIGKISIPDQIINKPGRLTADEFQIMKRHPVDTMSMLDNLSQFSDIREIAGYHHERWDGKGYPSGLGGEEIPLGSRIIAIADTYDAMTSERSYRKAMTHSQAIDEIRRNAGTQFDPMLAEIFVRMTDSDFPNRKRLIFECERLPYRQTLFKRTHARNIKTRPPDDVQQARFSDINDIFQETTLAEAVMDNSPIVFSVVDQNFNIIFASKSLAATAGISYETLLKSRCYEINGGKMCCIGDDSPFPNCPAVRSERNGVSFPKEEAVGFKGKNNNYEAYIIPLKLSDESNERFPCLMEIIIDRSDENHERDRLRNDARTFLNMLLDVVTNMDEDENEGLDDILHKCDDFSDYLIAMHSHLRFLTGTRRKRRDTI